MKNFESFDPMSEADEKPIIQEVAESQPEIPASAESFLPSTEYAMYKLLNGKYGLKQGVNNKNLIE